MSDCIYFSSLRRVYVSLGAEWCVKAAADLWLCKTPGGSPTTGSFCSMMHWSTRRYMQEYVLQLHSSDILLQFIEPPQHPPGGLFFYICSLKGFTCALYFSITQGALPSQLLVSTSAVSWSTLGLQQHGCAGLRLVLPYWQGSHETNKLMWRQNSAVFKAGSHWEHWWW